MGCQRGLTGPPPMQPGWHGASQTLATDSNFDAFNFEAAPASKIIVKEAPT